MSPEGTLITVVLIILWTIFAVGIIGCAIDWEELKYKRTVNKELGKGYVKVLQELKVYRGVSHEYSKELRRNMRRIVKIINLYEENPKEYAIYMHKYMYAISLIKVMLDEAENMCVLGEVEFNEDLSRLIAEVEGDFEEKERLMKSEDETRKKMEMMVLRGQMEEEVEMLREIKKLRGE